jgi:hypothetical protein
MEALVVADRVAGRHEDVVDHRDTVSRGLESCLAPHVIASASHASSPGHAPAAQSTWQVSTALGTPGMSTTGWAHRPVPVSLAHAASLAHARVHTPYVIA